MTEPKNEKTAYEDITSGDVVLQEVWQVKESLAAQYGYDIKKMCEAAREREKTSGHPVVNFQKSDSDHHIENRA